MSVKNDVFKILDSNKDKYYSGEQIAGMLGVSRTSVWKAVKKLISEGYDIEGINKVGYCMKKGDDIISKEGIMRFLPDDMKDIMNFITYKSITSTNTVLKQMASENAKEWTVLIAEQQTAGKGRMNRQFYSPKNTGVYMSILLRPKFSAVEALFITTMTAVAVADAIDELFLIDTGIKWVNDIYYNGKKICGILTEAAVNVENSKIDYAVVGIGINVKTAGCDFPDKIKDIAGSIIDSDISGKSNDDLRNCLIAKISENMYKYYLKLDKHEFMSKYIEKSILIGKEVYILSDEKREPLLVTGIDDNASLIVKCKNGDIKNISSGEVSVRLL